ncbi:MAG TPA: hypothetical protein VGS11_05365 [Candidatus Bathyarchaeia archaeon]|nr:hypothetical protein [Candidatus Bathyarchaeia archaeon]
MRVHRGSLDYILPTAPVTWWTNPLNESTQLILIGFALTGWGGLVLAVLRSGDLFFSWPGPLRDLGVTIWFLLVFSLWSIIPAFIIGAILILWGFLISLKRPRAKSTDRIARTR